MQEITLKLAIDDVNMILEGVGTLPFARVYALVGKIQEQAARQLDASRPSQAGEGAARELAVQAAG